MSEIIDLRGASPYPAVTDARKAGARTWFEITEEQSMEFLEAVPPIYFSGGFFVGEAAAHDARGVAVHAAIVSRNGRHFMREIATDRQSVEAALLDLTAALDLLFVLDDFISPTDRALLDRYEEHGNAL